MGRILAVVNQKGGVGKTTTAVNLSASLAATERKILLVDFDPQGNASTAFGINKQSKQPTIYDLLAENTTADQAVHILQVPWLSLIPASPDLAGAEVELVNEKRREFFLKKTLGLLRESYDLIIIDCPPSLGLLTLNCLVAADSILVPLQCEFLSVEGLSQLLDTVDLVHKKLNPDLAIAGILLTMFANGQGQNNQVARDVRQQLGKRVLQTVIPRISTVSESPSFGKPILWYDPWSEASWAYMQLAQELISRQTVLGEG
ncbi:MAG: ParA family protein [Magnetococcales bacterium]|nr:ParA family protein [Magnetococcales bacterium]